MNLFTWSVTFSVAIVGLAMLIVPAIAQDVYFGTGRNNAGKPEGIYVANFDEAEGKLTPAKLSLELKGAGWVTKHPTLDVLYSTANINGEHSVSAIDVSAAEARAIGSEATGGGGSCFITTDQTGNVLISTQYGGGKVSVFPLLEDGSLQPRSQLIEHGEPSRVQKNQKSAHPHYAGISPDNRFAFVCDLGMDKIVVYQIDHQAAKLKEVSQVLSIPGGGPRHMKFHPNGKFALLLNELTLSVSVYKYEAESGLLTMLGTTEALTEEEKALNTFNSASEIRIHPSGKFVYTGNRGHDSISVYQFNSVSGSLERTGLEPVRGSWPRNFNLSPSGDYLLAAGKDSNCVSVFTVNQETGGLQYLQHSPTFVPAPICVMFEKR